MAKSYKRNPGMSDGDCHKKFQKRQAARKVRHYKMGLSNGSFYKRLYAQWDICDWNYRCFSWREMWEDTIKRFDYDWGAEEYKTDKKVLYQYFWRYVRK